MQNTNKIIIAEGATFDALKATIEKSFALREQAIALEQEANDTVQKAVEEIFPGVKGANIDVRYAEFGRYYLHVTQELPSPVPADTVLSDATSTPDAIEG